MTDIEQFKDLLGGNIKTDCTVPDKNKQNFNHWTGIVVNNNDPDKLGKIQIKIYGYYDDLALNNIPWAIPDINSFTSTKGNFIVPELNSIVRGYFDNGDDSKPIYDSLAFNSSYNSIESNFQNYWLINDDYPHTMILFQTDNNDLLVMNRKTGEISFSHHTGTSTKIDADGTIDISTGTYSGGPAKCNVNVAGNITINSYGNVNLKAQRNVTINSVLGNIELGNNVNKQLINNIPTCYICGAPHTVGNVQVKV